MDLIFFFLEKKKKIKIIKFYEKDMLTEICREHKGFRDDI